MRGFLLVTALVTTTFASAQIKTYSLTDGSVYTKLKYNLISGWKDETGLGGPVAKDGNFSLGYNVGFVRAYPRLSKNDSWTIGLTLSFRLEAKSILYSKVASDWRGHWQQETGAKYTIYATKTFNIVANLGYVLNYPLHLTSKPQWTSGLQINFPLKSL